MLGFVPLATTGFAAETALSYVLVSVTGVSATVSLGAALPAADVTVDLDGVYAEGIVGILPAMPSGVRAVGSVSSVLVWSVIVNPATQTPNWTVIPT